MKKKFIVFLFGIATCIVTLSASNTEVDGIWYDFDVATKTASVTYHGYNADTYKNEYSGSVVIPSNVSYNTNTYTVTKIGANAFSDCNTLISVSIPNSVTKIDYNAFKGCALVSVVLPNSITIIGISAFAYNSQLTQVTLPDNEVVIDSKAFYNCTNLSNINFPSAHGKIVDIYRNSLEGTAFYNDASNWEDNELYWNDCLLCANADITGFYSIKEGTRIIAGGAFYQCNLTSIVMPNSVTHIGNEWGSCPNLEHVTLSENLTQIPAWAFNRAPKLKKIVIPDKVDTIQAYAFGDCDKLDTIIIGNGIKYIAQGAISWCYDIYVEFTSPTPPDVKMTYSYEAFSGSNPQFYVPCGSIPAYKDEIHKYSDDHWHEKISIPYAIDTEDSNKGFVTIIQTPTCDNPEVSFYATPLNGFVFMQWSDGSTDNPRVLTLTKDTTITAQWTSALILPDTENPMPVINAAVGNICNVIIERTIYRNGDYNTFCVPFDVDDITTGALAGFTVKEFNNAVVENDNLLIELSEVNSIKANIPYFIKYNGNETPLTSLTFHNVTLNNGGASTVKKGDIVLHGTIEPFYMDAQTLEEHSYLFLGAGNTLYWPNVSNNIKPFRAYFSFTPASTLNSPVHRDMSARIVEHENIATAIKNTDASANLGGLEKRFEKGQLVIIKNGVKYNVQGQIVK